MSNMIHMVLPFRRLATEARSSPCRGLGGLRNRPRDELLFCTRDTELIAVRDILTRAFRYLMSQVRILSPRP